MSETRRLVVIGNGMAGARLVEDVLVRGGGDLFAVTVFVPVSGETGVMSRSGTLRSRLTSVAGSSVR